MKVRGFRVASRAAVASVALLVAAPVLATTTVYVLIKKDPALSGDVSSTYSKSHCDYRQGKTHGVGTGNHQCGRYWDGTQYDLSTKFSGTLNYLSHHFVRSDNNRGEYTPLASYMVGSAPVGGTEIGTWQVYHENANDNGDCVDSDGNSYTKYSATY